MFKIPSSIMHSSKKQSKKLHSKQKKFNGLTKVENKLLKQERGVWNCFEQATKNIWIRVWCS